ncbi:lactonase family protein [Catenulispora pinisilvae]|uniref:lactonase family protein n=1 Tax=Catenulispora pinisilvae TaxID=2705253 RepID=UPI00189147C0|nr:lactonase family protein [Catenulispora pinisilvae]
MVDSANSYLLVGGYGVGVHCLRYAADGALSPVSVVDIADPSYVVYDDARGVLTAVVEQEPDGRVASARFTVAEGGSDVRDRTASGGAAPCHLASHPDGTTLFVANYISGTVGVFPLDAEGRVSGTEPVQVIQHTGSGPRADRQEGPHAHQVVVSPSGRWVLAVDLGTDSVYVYEYSAGRLAAHSVVALPGGSGPRHLAFHGSGRYFYLLNEVSWTVAVCSWDEAAGTGEAGLQVQSRAEADRAKSDRAWCSAIRVSADDRFLYASNRIDDTIAVFSIVGDGAALEPVEVVPAGGAWPRDIVLSPDGTLLFSANQHSDSITVFRVDAGTGRLTPVGTPYSVKSPASLLPIAG